MKVNIITCHTPYNYGAVLQCHALTSFLRSNGCEIAVIDYVTPPLEQRNILFSICRKAVRYIDFKQCKSVFGTFLSESIPLTGKRYLSIADLKSEVPVADAYIAGSDQIWNAKLKNGSDDSFYLSFVPEDKRRISYAVSMAMTQIPNHMKHFYIERLQKFDFLSVRETSAVTLLKNLGLNHVNLVLDPVYLLDPGQWNAFSDKYDTRERYVLIYCFCRKKEYYEYAKRLARQRGLKVYIVSNLWSDRRFAHDRFFWVPTPQRFISLLQNAESVVTNSFHGLSFSILFQKDVHVFDSVNGSVRVLDALKQFGLEDRLVSNDFKRILSEECDYSYAQPQMERLLESSKEFLLKSIQ